MWKEESKITKLHFSSWVVFWAWKSVDSTRLKPTCTFDWSRSTRETHWCDLGEMTWFWTSDDSTTLILPIEISINAGPWICLLVKVSWAPVMISVTRGLHGRERNYFNILYNVMFLLFGMKCLSLIKEKIFIDGEDFSFICEI